MQKKRPASYSIANLKSVENSKSLKPKGYFLASFNEKQSKKDLTDK